MYNIGNSNSVRLLDFISEVEKQLGKEAIKDLQPIQAGDVAKTFADVSGLQQDYDYAPNTSVNYGIEQFVSWYKEFFDES